jgi:signal transduction histidine kinase
MNGLIRDLLSFSRLNAGPRMSVVSLSAVARSASFFLQAEQQKAGAAIMIDELPEVSGDENQLNRLFVELFANALKFRTERPPRIHVSGAEVGEEVVISVSDNGQGIDPNYREQVFGVFKRLHSRDVPGNGIGLALCRKIVRAHGGRIWVESDGASGSTFRFALPAC